MELVLAQLPTDLSVSQVGKAKDLQGRFGGRGSSWSREETSILLDVYEVEMAKEDANFDKNSPTLAPKFQSIYRTISDVLTQHGFQRSPMQVRERLKRLKRDVREHKQGEFTARVSAIVGRSPYTRPSLIQQAALGRDKILKEINEKDRIEGYYPVTDMMSTEISYPDDDEPTSDSPISMNAEVPEGVSSETDHHDSSSSSEHEESKSTHSRNEKQRVPSANGHSTVIAAPKEKSSLSTSSSSSSMRSSPVMRSPPHTPHLPLHPAPTRSQTPYTHSMYVAIENAYRQRIYKEEMDLQPVPSPALPMNLSIHQGMMYTHPTHTSLVPPSSKSQTPVIQPPQRSASPQCSHCSQTLQEQRRINALLQKIVSDNKANSENQLLFQRQMLAHLNCITYTLQGLAAQRICPDSKRYSSSESHSNPEDNDACSPPSPIRDLH